MQRSLTVYEVQRTIVKTNVADPGFFDLSSAKEPEGWSVNENDVSYIWQPTTHCEVYSSSQQI